MKRLKLTNLMMVVIAVGVLFSGAGLPGAEGSLIRHTFSGTINHVVAGPPPAPWEGAGLESTWELSYIFDTGLPDQNPGDSREGRYFIDNGSISMDGVELFAVSGVITVNDGLLGFDEFRVLLFDTPLGGGTVQLAGPPGTLASDAIPINLDLADWNSSIFQFGGGQAFFFNGNVLTFTSTVVPGVGGLPLILLSSCFFVRNRRRRSPG